MIYLIANLTGHEINILNYPDLTLNKVIPICPFEPSLRAYANCLPCDNIEDIPVIKFKYSLKEPLDYLLNLSTKYDGIIVSKITADALISIGYTGAIYITGKKLYRSDGLIGIAELSLYN